MISKYDRVTKNYERAIATLRQNLQYLANKGAVSEKFISIQNKTLQSLGAYQQTVELIISGQEMELTQLMMGKSREFDKLKDQIIAMEAICLIHGIIDFPCWLVKGKNYLEREAIELNKLRTVQIPLKIIRSNEPLTTK